MPTSVGWTHDIGYESTFIHDKPVLQDGGLSGPSTNFVSFLRFYLSRYNLTRDMLRALGSYDYKYVVIPSYTTDEVRSFILSQRGSEPIYNSNGSVILETPSTHPDCSHQHNWPWSSADQKHCFPCTELIRST